MLDKETIQKILTFQRSEITEYYIYKKLSGAIKELNNKEVLRRISDDELKHYNLWKAYTEKEVKPDNVKIWFYYLISRIFGLTFGVKLMEKGESEAQNAYEAVSSVIPQTKDIIKDENEHERELLNLIDEERLKYVGSIVLGLNDALVELTGALAGLTFAFGKIRLIAVAGLVTGIAASFSMAASEYLSTKSEGGKSPLKASVYTGFAYILTVFFLIFPYLIFNNPYFCLGFAITNAIIVILIFTFYVSIAQDIPFLKRFSEMAIISLGVATLSFIIGYFIRQFFNIDI